MSTHSKQSEKLIHELASLMHDSGKCYLMIGRDERYENNMRLANDAYKLFESYAQQEINRVLSELKENAEEYDMNDVMMIEHRTGKTLKAVPVSAIESYIKEGI